MFNNNLQFGRADRISGVGNGSTKVLEKTMVSDADCYFQLKRFRRKGEKECSKGYGVSGESRVHLFARNGTG